MLELAFICYVAVSQPSPPPKPKEVYIERLVGLPAKELEFTSLTRRAEQGKDAAEELEFASLTRRAEQGKDAAEPNSRVRKLKFGRLRQLYRRGNRNH